MTDVISAGGACGLAGVIGRSARALAQVRAQLVGAKPKDRSSPYGTPKGLRSPLASPLVTDPQQARRSPACQSVCWLLDVLFQFARAEPQVLAQAWQRAALHPSLWVLQDV